MAEIEPRDEDLTRVVEVAALIHVLGRYSAGETVLPPRQLGEWRNDLAVSLIGALEPTRAVPGPEWPTEGLLGVTTDTSVMASGLRTFTQATAEALDAAADLVSERGEGAAELAQLLAKLDAAIELGNKIMHAVRPVAVTLNSDELTDLEVTAVRGGGSWARLARLLLATTRQEQQARENPDPGEIPGEFASVLVDKQMRYGDG